MFKPEDILIVTADVSRSLHWPVSCCVSHLSFFKENMGLLVDYLVLEQFMSIKKKKNTYVVRSC